MNDYLNEKKYFNRIKLLGIIIILIFPYVVYPQFTSLEFERITIDQGLSNNSVNSILQTSDGFLWIATKDGLNRFDGKSFKIFKNDFADSTSLPQNYIMTLLEDFDKNLWIGTWGGGLSKFIAETESFLSYNFPEEFDDYVQCLYQDDEGDIWFGTLDGGFNKLYLRSNTLTNFSNLKGNNYYFPSNNITCIKQIDSVFWIGTWDKGLFKFFDVSFEFTQYLFDENKPDSEPTNLIWDIFIKNDHEFLFSTDNGLVSFNIESGKTTQILKGNIIRQIIKDNKDRIWVGSYDYKGIFLFENDNLENDHSYLEYSDTDPYTLTGNRIRWMYVDRLKNIWIGTEDGLNKLPRTKEFIQYRYFPIGKSSIGGRVVSSICEGKNNILWVGYGGSGFDKINLSTGETNHYSSQYGNHNSLSSIDVVTLFEDSEGILWVGTRTGGLSRFDPLKNEFKHYLKNKNSKTSIKSDWVHQILELNESELLIGTNESLEIFSKNNERFELFNPKLNPASLKLPNSLSVNALCKDSRDHIWIGTWLDGIFQYDPKKQNLNHYLPERGNKNSISSNKITSITEDSKNNIWIGTHSGGVNKLQPDKMIFTHYDTQNGLPNDVVFGIIEDDSGYLWFSTMKGLVKFEPNHEQFRIYNKSDGIINNQFNWHAYYKNKYGILYFGGINGFISFDPNDITVDEVTHPVRFISFKVNDKEINDSYSLINNNLIKLDYYQNFFSVEFMVLDFIPPIKHNYLYKLEGLDENWIEAGSANIASYTDIEPGEYEFIVKASNPDGFWSDSSKLKILILPPWWATRWFRTGLILMLGLLGYFIYNFRVNQLLEIERIRLNISRDLHDEIGSNLSSISVESQMLMNSVNLNSNEKSQISHIKKVAVETMDAMRDIIWFINPQHDWEQDYLLKLKETASNLLVGINWTFSGPKDLNLNYLNLEAKRNIFLIYKEILTNISKHAKADKCIIFIKSSLNKLSFVISDNGIGFNKNNLIRKNGLVNIQNRADKIRAKFKIVSKLGSGTKVYFEINN